MALSYDERAILLLGAGVVGGGVLLYALSKSKAKKSGEDYKGIVFSETCVAPLGGSLYQVEDEPQWADYRRRAIAQAAENALASAQERSELGNAPEVIAWPIANNLMKSFAPQCPSWNVEQQATGGGEELDAFFKSIHAEVAERVEGMYDGYRKEYGYVNLENLRSGVNEQ
jgi:hypothetical protein